LRHYEQVTFRAGVSWVTQRFGILAIRVGDTPRGVRILVATRDIGAMLKANFPELVYERRMALDSARDVLGDEAFTAEWARGEALTLEDASRLATQPLPVEHLQRRSSGPLTARQQEVASLIARGLTNAQIAKQLVVSRHTVERHVENILDKLRLSSRIEIAIWTLEQERG
jgi:non-specific serine/threonine protein kinase